MNTLKHPIVGLIFFVILVTLCINIYIGFETHYGITETGTQTVDGEDGNLMEHLGRLSILTTIENFQNNIQKIVAPAGFIDLLGALAGAAIGVLQIVWDIFTFPLQIMNIILLFYNIPMIVVTGLNLIILVYVGFIILRAYLGSRI